MTWTTRRTVTLVAIALVVVSLPLTWQIADVRAAQAVQHTQADLVTHQVTSRQAPSDYDGDGIADARDVCPTRPETVNGFQDGDGCPDIVSTTGAS